MFEKLRGAVSKKAAELKEISGVPSDLGNVPRVDGDNFGAVDPAVLGAYLGRPVESIAPMGALGPAATSFLGQRIQDRLREGAENGLAPGEFIPGQAGA